MITMEAYWKGPDHMGRDVNPKYADQLTDEIRENAAATVEKANQLLMRAGMPFVTFVNSGWRPQEVNEATRNAASHSSHLTGEAIDISDPNGALDKWCLAHPEELARLGLWAEHPGWTDGWCHVQTRGPGWPPQDQPRIYIPSSKPPTVTIYGNSPVYA